MHSESYRSPWSRSLAMHGQGVQIILTAKTHSYISFYVYKATYVEMHYYSAPTNKNPIHLNYCILYRRRVSQEARKQWPGNDIPTFQDKDQTELDELVEKLVPTCKLERYFDAKGIKTHIQDC